MGDPRAEPDAQEVVPVEGMTGDGLHALLDSVVREISRRTHGTHLPARHPGRAPFRPGVDEVPYAGRVFGPDEVVAAVRSASEFWLTLGREGEALERELAGVLGVRRTILANSGSSANLLAMTALTSPLVGANRRVMPGDEVISCAAGFPTTVAPIVQAGAVPVLVDADPLTGNIRADLLEEAFDARRTRAVFVAHTLGNPIDIASVLAFCRKHGLWLIEDNCDALGSTYSMPRPLYDQLGFGSTDASSDRITRMTGAWGDLSTQSFYPPHHITMGEGGAVNIVRNIRLRRPVESFRDWGRDCWCASGVDDTCGKRFGWQLGELPEGYDHKYTYSHLGYNLKPLDLQAAIGRVQLSRLHEFGQARRDNWTYLRNALDGVGEFLEFSLPTHACEWTLDGPVWDASGCRTDPSWFGFMLLVRPDAPFDAADLARFLSANRVGHRRLFGGNLVRQPAFARLRHERPEAIRVVGDLVGADRLMNDAVFVGTYPGLTSTMLEYVADAIRGFVMGAVH